MNKSCERCEKIETSFEPLVIINPSNNPFGFSGKTTLLCKECRKIWYLVFAITNGSSNVVINNKKTKEAWKEFMKNEGKKEKVQFT